MKFSLQRIHEIASEISKKKWEHLKQRRESQRTFDAYPNILCVFQTFNKSHLIRLVLNPFIKRGFKNIILFADGCIDNTLTKAASILKGKNHLVISVNDVHEIRNYRFAITSESGKNCEFALLMQDDDLYPIDFSWLDYGLEMMKRDPGLVVIGYAGGFDFTSMSSPSNTFQTDSYYHDGEETGILGSWTAKNMQVFSSGPNQFNFGYCQAVYRAPHLIRVMEFLECTKFDPLFEPFQDDDTNYCLELWSKGYRVGLVNGAVINRDIGIGGMRLSNVSGIDRRPEHAARNYKYLFNRYGAMVNSGELGLMVKKANEGIIRKFLYL
jgi:glycosyltransferase involved in cell wall biosynthesis